MHRNLNISLLEGILNMYMYAYACFVVWFMITVGVRGVTMLIIVASSIHCHIFLLFTMDSMPVKASENINYSVSLIYSAKLVAKFI